MRHFLTLAAILLTVSCASQKTQNSLPMNQTTITLNNGVQIPQFGLGVYSIPAGETTYNSVLTALKAGYRHIDTAHAYGKSAAQVIIRWHIQKGFCVVPGSSNPKHIQENIEVFDFELSPEEMAKMASLNQEKRYFNMTYQQIKDWMENYEIWD